MEVPRDASQRDIKKAYRKQAQKWHPDKYKGELNSEEVQNKMSKINLAYEVLGNEGNLFNKPGRVEGRV